MSGDIMRFERDERRFDFHKIGLAIKRAREARGMTQEDLAYVIDRTPRTIMYSEDGFIVRHSADNTRHIRKSGKLACPLAAVACDDLIAAILARTRTNAG